MNSNDSPRDWRKGAVIYQIYPRSFRDTNGDGVGDLKGIINGLDYVASLGVDAIWMSPFFISPMKDFGYDVADYCDVDPIFGTLENFDRLVDKAHKLGLKVIIDQVYSHTSDRHAWFQESRTSKDSAKADWYVWADPQSDGSPPTNWQSVFGGPAWEWDGRRGKYYLHNFLASQPDLNLHNAAVQDALLEVARFWLDRGVDGFRLDAINFAMHDPQLRDNPPAKDTRKATRPFEMQEHLYNQSHPDIPKFLERIRSVTDEYPERFTVAEIVGAEPMAEMKAFTADHKRLTTAYNFDFLYARKLTPALVKKALGGWTGEPGETLPSWAFSNHDAPRAVSRWAKEEERTKAAKLYAMLLLSLRGNIFLYQGEELGLPQGKVPFEKLQDPEAIANWPKTLGRDGARTPFPWTKAPPNAGFTAGEPWLPVDSRHVELALDAQEKDKSSVLNFVRRMIALRAATSALRYGDIDFADTPDGLLAFERKIDNERLLCAFNLGEEEISWLPAQGKWSVIMSVGVGAEGTTPPDKLPPLSGYIAGIAS